MVSESAVEKKGVNLDITLGRLKQLSHEERILIGLFYYEKLSVPDIATALQTTAEQVQKALLKIYPKLFPSSGPSHAKKAVAETVG